MELAKKVDKKRQEDRETLVKQRHNDSEFFYVVIENLLTT